MRCQPGLVRMADAEALLNLVRASLGVPISLVSYGPSAADKQCVEKRV